MAMQVIVGDELGHELVDDVLLLGRERIGVRRVDGGEVLLVVSGHTLPSASVTVPLSCSILSSNRRSVISNSGWRWIIWPSSLKSSTLMALISGVMGSPADVGGIGKGNKLAQRDAVVVLEDLVIVVA